MRFLVIRDRFTTRAVNLDRVFEIAVEQADRGAEQPPGWVFTFFTDTEETPGRRHAQFHDAQAEALIDALGLHPLTEGAGPTVSIASYELGAKRSAA